MNEIVNYSVEELINKISNSQITSVEICEAYIERINKFEKDINAWAFFDKELLLEKAKESDAYKKSGKPTGPLHGIPVAVKDIVGTLDMPTECGTPIRKGKSYSQNAEIIDLLTSSGAIVMGKTVTTELAYLNPSKTKNPHDYSRTPGGSSSGSAAVIASYMAPLSIGSQTGGSIIRPASYCGVVGYKPSFGLISRNGVLKTSEKLDHLGVFGKTVEDIAYLVKELIKKDSHDPATVYYSSNNMVDAVKKGPLYEPKFIFYKTEFWKSIDKKSKEAFEYFVNSLRSNKLNVIDLEIDKLISKSDTLHLDISGYEFKRSISHERFNYYDQLSDQLRNGRLNDGYQVSNKNYQLALKDLSILKNQIDAVFDKTDLIITPSAPGEALKGLEYTGSPIFNTTWSLNGNPCITLPLFKGKQELPIGCQLVARFGDDDQLLNYAKAFLEL